MDIAKFFYSNFMEKFIKSRFLFCILVLLFVFINPLFAHEVEGIHIKEVIFISLGIFVAIFIILAILLTSNTIKDAVMVKSEIKYLTKKKKSKIIKGLLKREVKL